MKKLNVKISLESVCKMLSVMMLLFLCTVLTASNYVVSESPCNTPGPDFYITNESVSNTNPNVGDNITLSCRQNVSDATESLYTPYVRVGFYVSDDALLDYTDIFLTSRTSSIGTSDSSDPASISVDVESCWGTGTKYIFFRADFNEQITESVENNNHEYIQINISGNNTSLPDFYITDESVSNTNPNVGDNITLSCKQNVSDATESLYVPYVRVGFYVSDDALLDYTDIFLTSRTSSIGCSDSNDSASISVDVESSWGTGTKYIFFRADFNEQIAESVENNNHEYIQININGNNTSLPDLYISHETVSNTSPSWGDNITLSCRQNVSNPTEPIMSSYPKVGYFLSDDTLLDYTDTYLGIDASAIGSNNPYNLETINLTVESCWGTGIKYLFIRADFDEQVAESVENNNHEYIQINISGGLPDIYISHETVSNTSPSWGDNITLSCRQNVLNPTEPFINSYPRVKYYISDNQLLDGADPYLGIDASAIGCSAPYNLETINLTVESNWGTGTKYIFFRADANDGVIESAENNNYEHVQIYISANKTNSESTLDGNPSLDLANFTVFPNPAKDFVNITFEQMERVETVVISDYTGKETAVEYAVTDGDEMNLDVSNLLPGYYILTVKYGLGKIKSKKLLIQD